MKRLLLVRREQEQGSYTRQKNWIGYDKVTFLGMAGSVRQIS